MGGVLAIPCGTATAATDITVNEARTAALDAIRTSNRPWGTDMDNLMWRSAFEAPPGEMGFEWESREQLRNSCQARAHADEREDTPALVNTSQFWGELRLECDQRA
jgi:hypothetical protein